MISYAFLVYLIAGVSSELPADTSTTKTNVLFIMADDLRTDLESYGVKVVSPNLTQLTTSLLRLNLQIS